MVDFKSRHLHSKLFDVIFYTLVLFLNFFPFSLPVFYSAVNLLDLASVKLLSRRPYLLEFFINLSCLVLQCLGFTNRLLLQPISLIIEDIGHFLGCDLEVLPSLKHIVCIKRSPSHSSYIPIFHLDFLDFS